MARKPDRSQHLPSQQVPRNPDASRHVITHERRELSYHSGPLPDPRTLAEYDVVIPSGAERIVAAFERQGGHRQQLERWAVLNDIVRAYAGQIIGGLIAAGGLYVAYRLGMAGHEATASVIGGGTLVSLVSVFVLGKWAGTKERKEKAELMTGAQNQDAKRP